MQTVARTYYTSVETSMRIALEIKNDVSKELRAILPNLNTMVAGKLSLEVSRGYFRSPGLYGYDFVIRQRIDTKGKLFSVIPFRDYTNGVVLQFFIAPTKEIEIHSELSVDAEDRLLGDIGKTLARHAITDIKIAHWQ